MSNAIFPDLPGIAIDIERIHEWETTVKRSWSGMRTAVAKRAYPTWRYILKVDVLRASEGEILALQAFFNARMGRFEDFLFLDPEDSTVVDQPFGVCDGSSTDFRLVRAMGTWLEPVWAPAASPAPVIKRNGVTLIAGADYILGAYGAVQLTSAPASGTLTWSGSYYMRVNFVDDKLSLQRIYQGLWKSGKIEFETGVFA